MRYLRALHVASVAVVLGVAFASAACEIDTDGFGRLTGSASDEWSRGYPMIPGGELTILNVNGAIDVGPAVGSTIEVHAERMARALTDERARELLKSLQIKEEVAPNRVRIETNAPRDWTMAAGTRQIRYQVGIPNGLRATFETVNGGVHLANVSGHIVAWTTNGGVSARGVGGSLEARTVNGGVDVTMRAVSGDLAFRTTNGGIHLTLPGDTRASLEAQCVNGGVHIGEMGFNGDVSRRRARGTINGGGPRIEARTVNGGIHIGGS
jgi:hypothetical protein